MGIFLGICWFATLLVSYLASVRLLKKFDLY